jgi:alpha-galactosidase
MPDLAASIRDAGFTPGIWVAPFVAIRQSSVFRRGWVHPWKAGWNPLWGSSIYALDLSRPEVVDHVRRVGDTFHNWGFGLVKADFLYAAALHPWGGRTRAQRMREAMRLLREVMPGQLLACGVPLASAAGLCDFNRLGPDTAPKWEDSLLSFCRYRERVSNLNALRTILARWFMNGTLFALDPDVFILGQSKLTPAERQTLFDVTTTLGGMQSFSDSIGRLAPEARDLVKRVFPLADLAVLSVTEEAPDLFSIAAPSGGGDRVLLRVNLADRPQGGLPPHASKLNRLPSNH